MGDEQTTENLESIPANDQIADAQLEGGEGQNADAGLEGSAPEAQAPRKMPAHLTPEEKAVREQEIAAEAANFTPENFPADKPDEDLGNNKYFLFSATLKMRLPKDTNMPEFFDKAQKDFIAGVPNSFVEKFLNELIGREIPKNEEVVSEQILIEVPREMLLELTSADESKHIYCGSVNIDGEMRSVSIQSVL